MVFKGRINHLEWLNFFPEEVHPLPLVGSQNLATLSSDLMLAVFTAK